MCFSPTASFIASGILASTGGFIVAKGHSSKMKSLSLIPFVFALQQFAEGWIWILPEAHSGIKPLAIIFLIGAFGFWPIAVPFFTYLIETRKERFQLLKRLSYLGLFIGLYLLTILLITPFTISKRLGNIDYEIDVPLGELIFAWYGAVTVGALLLSTHPWIRGIGILSGLTYLLSNLWYNETFISVWCFFEAGIGILLGIHILHQKKLSLKTL